MNRNKTVTKPSEKAFKGRFNRYGTRLRFKSELEQQPIRSN
jgi:hypothetical protein